MRLSSSNAASVASLVVLVTVLAILDSCVVETEAFASSSTSVQLQLTKRPSVKNNSNNNKLLFSTALTSSTPDETANAAGAGAADSPSANTASSLRKKQRKELIRKEGGLFAFDTKFGALNPFAIYYGLTSILLGLPWYAALSLYQLVLVVTRGRFDKNRRIPTFINQAWGEALMFLTRCHPRMEGRDMLNKFCKG